MDFYYIFGLKNKKFLISFLWMLEVVMNVKLRKERL